MSLSNQTITENKNPAATKSEVIGEKRYIVTDLGVTPDYPKRTHELIVNGKREKFDFMYGVNQLFSKEIALRFLPIEGFSVSTEDGKIIEPAPKTPENMKHILPPEFCVAKLSELKKEALLQRAVPLPGGDVFNVTSTSAEMVEFITKYNASKIPSDRDSDEDEGLDGQGMKLSEVDRLFQLDPTTVGI